MPPMAEGHGSPIPTCLLMDVCGIAVPPACMSPGSPPQEPERPSAAPLADTLAALSTTLLPQCMASEDAERLFGGMLCQALACHPELGQTLAKFGWAQGRWAVPFVDMHGVRAALQQYIYSPELLIGRGAYGSVHRGFHRETNAPIAIKQIKTTSTHGLCDATVREIAILRELNHENIIRLIDVVSYCGCKHVYLILELLDCDLHAARRYHPAAFDAACIKMVMLQILSGLRHAHAHGVMHRDLKPQNILLNKHTGQVKIADFGMSRGFLPDEGPNAYTDWVMTLLYRAPELLLGSQQYNGAVDMWSTGCVMAELFNGEPLFQAEAEPGVLNEIWRKVGTPTQEVLHRMTGGRPPSIAVNQLPPCQPLPAHRLVPALANDPLGQDLLLRLLSFDPRVRITAAQAVRHPWFHGVTLPGNASKGVAAAATTAAPTAFSTHQLPAGLLAAATDMVTCQ